MIFKQISELLVLDQRLLVPKSRTRKYFGAYTRSYVKFDKCDFLHSINLRGFIVGRYVLSWTDDKPFHNKLILSCYRRLETGLEHCACRRNPANNRRKLNSATKHKQCMFIYLCCIILIMYDIRVFKTWNNKSYHTLLDPTRDEGHLTYHKKGSHQSLLLWFSAYNFLSLEEFNYLPAGDLQLTNFIMLYLVLHVLKWSIENIVR